MSGMVWPATGRPPDIDNWINLLGMQNGNCGICQRHFASIGTPNRRVAMPMLDHDHDTGLVRGLLCCSCNVKLGRPPDYCGAAKSVCSYLKDPPAMQNIEGGILPLLPYTPSISARLKGGYATSRNGPGIWAVAPLGERHGGLQVEHSERIRSRWLETHQ